MPTCRRPRHDRTRAESYVAVCVGLLVISGCGSKSEPSDFYRSDWTQLLAPLTDAEDVKIVYTTDVDWTTPDSPDYRHRSMVANFRTSLDGARARYAATRAEVLKQAASSGLNIANPNTNEVVSPSYLDSVAFHFSTPSGGEGELTLIIESGHRHIKSEWMDGKQRQSIVTVQDGDDAFCLMIDLHERPRLNQ